jgi:hypothetical protein
MEHNSAFKYRNILILCRARKISICIHNFFIFAVEERSVTILLQDFTTAPGCAATTHFDKFERVV